MANDDKGPRGRRITLDEVAQEASVSTATVSKVLNERPGVAEVTRQRVNRILRSHGYSKPGTDADYSPVIDLIFGALDGAWAIELIRGTVSVAGENGLSVTVSESGDRHATESPWIRAAVKRQPVGVILVGSDLPAGDKYLLRSRNIPFVMVDPAGDPAPDVPSVGSTNWAGGSLATKHLIDLGHTRIGVVAGPDDLMATHARVAGYRFAMQSAGLPIDEDIIAVQEFEDEASPEAGHQLLSRANRPTAIFATSDVKALGTYEAARSLGISVPDDLSIVGYDDLQFARWAGPPLTTIRQPLNEMAQEAARFVIAARNHGRHKAERVELVTTLVVRNSTRRLG
jgi:LacI family xylobiose transport system transcriptional regulator